MHTLLILIVMLLILVQISHSLMITEIMYDPLGNFDDDLEWIEIYNNSTETINLTNWLINSKDFDDIDILPNTYIVIARELIDDNDNDSVSFEAIYGNNDSIWDSSDIIKAVDGNFILNNTQGIVNLSNGTVDYLAEYNDTLGGNNNGRTLQLIDGMFLESGVLLGSPGKNNTLIIRENVSKGLRISLNIDKIVYKDTHYKNIFRIDNLAHIPGNNDSINLTIGYNISGLISNISFIVNLNAYTTSNTGEFLINITGNFTLCGGIINSTAMDTNLNDNYICENITVIELITLKCDVSISISTEKIVYEDETIHFSNLINNTDYPFVIEYWIDDIFGGTIKDKLNTTNTNKKQFTPSIEDKLSVFVIKNRLYTGCNDTNLSNNFAEKSLIVINNNIDPKNLEEESRIKIDDIIIEDKINHGDSMKVRLNIYKGKSRKSSIKLWIEGSERISEITSLNLNNQYTDYVVTVPIKLKDNCNIESGEYKVIAEGLDTDDKESIEIKFKDCKKEKNSTNSERSDKGGNSKKVVVNNKTSMRKVDNTQRQTILKLTKQTSNPKSKNEIIKRAIPWFIALTSTIISIVLIWKR